MADQQPEANGILKIIDWHTARAKDARDCALFNIKPSLQEIAAGHEEFVAILRAQLSRLQAGGGVVAFGDDEENDLVRVISQLDRVVSGETVTSSDRMFDRSIRPRKMTIKDAQAIAAPCAAILRKVVSAIKNQPTATTQPESAPVAAPAMVPLTDEQINEMALQEQFLLVCDDIEALTEIVRAVELAHGINNLMVVDKREE